LFVKTLSRVLTKVRNSKLKCPLYLHKTNLAKLKSLFNSIEDQAFSKLLYDDGILT
jgi:hypothetical protein